MNALSGHPDVAVPATSNRLVATTGVALGLATCSCVFEGCQSHEHAGCELHAAFIHARRIAEPSAELSDSVALGIRRVQRLSSSVGSRLLNEVATARRGDPQRESLDHHMQFLLHIPLFATEPAGPLPKFPIPPTALKPEAGALIPWRSIAQQAGASRRRLGPCGRLGVRACVCRTHSQSAGLENESPPLVSLLCLQSPSALMRMLPSSTSTGDSM